MVDEELLIGHIGNYCYGTLYRTEYYDVLRMDTYVESGSVKVILGTRRNYDYVNGR